MNRARAKRRVLAWDRYRRHYATTPYSLGRECAAHRWWMRAHRHHTTHAGIQAVRKAAS